MAILWTIAFAVFLVIETMTLEFSCLSIAIGCLLGAGAAGLGLPLGVQIGVVTVGSIASLFLLAPVLRHRLTPRDTADGVNAMIGTEAEVVESIAPPAQGKVKVDGVVWQAVSNVAIPQGARVMITEVSGACLTVLSKDQLLNPQQTRHSAPLPPEPQPLVRPEAQPDTLH